MPFTATSSDESDASRLVEKSVQSAESRPQPYPTTTGTTITTSSVKIPLITLAVQETRGCHALEARSCSARLQLNSVTGCSFVFVSLFKDVKLVR